jgi:zinc/manganese transport system substrate-binding protein
VSVVYTEPVPEYLVTAAGLHVEEVEGFASAIEEGVEPSPASTAKMNSLFTEHKVSMLFYNSQATSPVTENTKKVANQAGIPVVGVTETVPPSEATYQSWQLGQLNAILKALEGKS